MAINGLGIWLLVTASVWAQDLVVLKSGGRIEGRVVAEAPASITITVPGGMMELNRTDIATIEKGKLPAPSDAAASRPSQSLLAALNRFGDSEEWFLLEKGGRRIGWRVVTSLREEKSGIPCYARRDRAVIPGTPDRTEVESIVTEWVDATLKPVAFSSRLVSGSAIRTIDGRYGTQGIEVVERSAGIERVRQLPYSVAPELPGFLMKRRSREPNSEATEGLPVLDPRRGEVVAGVMSKRRPAELRSGSTQVRIAIAGGLPLTSMDLDSQGVVSREEIGGSDLVAIRTDPKSVSKAIAEGFTISAPLKRVPCAEVGMTLDLPDDTWIALAPAEAESPVLSWWHPSSQTSIEVFALPTESSLDEMLSDLASRVAASDPTAIIRAAVQTTLGDFDGFSVDIQASRRGRMISTYAFVAKGPAASMLVLVSTPNAEKSQLPTPTQLLATMTRIEGPKGLSAE